MFQRSKSSKLGLNADDFLFLDSTRYSHVSSLTGTAVCRFHAPVYFATLSVFKQQLFASSISLSELKARQTSSDKQKDVLVSVEITDSKAPVETGCDGNGRVIEVGSANESTKLKNESDGLSEENNGESALMPESVDGKYGSDVKQGEMCDIQNIVVDCNTVPFVDTAGCMLLAQLHTEYSKHGIKFVLAGCCDDVVCTLQRAEQCQTLCKDALYPSVQSAVLCLHCDLF